MHLLKPPSYSSKSIVKKYILIAFVCVVLFLLAGFFIPIGSYTTTNGCSIDPTPTVRLHLLKGNSIQDIKDGDVQPAPNVGCSTNTRYVLYLL